ncbi:uncharacterized protein B0P05DRAFT_536254 [Gilbertella persicaria]|uniref:uncharacterized protein n=1 Tax=Gilbertella persicaria TaxID=101096 RepID=UPI0022205107|nr:uncharacterized protein B0P05DRAFT_536254 [Gilbertella persicaria]KAI8084127.1 hypothetical protein B0P05DRAFT_536254 [Gilbertella persicaria]
MSNLLRISRIRLPNTPFARCVSTQYVPGRKGYAPGFEAPEGAREEPKVVMKRRVIGHSLTSHLEGKSRDIKTESPKKLYRQALKSTRHKYAHELLEKQGQKQLRSDEKLAMAEKKAQTVKQTLEAEKKQQQEHEQEVVDMLDLKATQEQSRLDRHARREENRVALQETQRAIRRKQLLKLYAATDSFVTLDNLDARVDAVMSSEGRSFHASFDELMHSTSSVQTEIEQRKQQLREVMGL